MTTQSYEEMTPKDDLVERVAQKIGAALRDGEQLDGATRAAIAAYFDAGEVHTERAAISLADKYEEKIAKLGADLIAWRSAFQDVTPGGSEFMHPQSVRDYARKLKDETVQAKLDRARIQKDFAKLEAEAAAMREALEAVPKEDCGARLHYSCDCPGWNSARSALLEWAKSKNLV